MLRKCYMLNGHNLDNLSIDTLWAMMRSGDTPYLCINGRLGILSSIERESGSGRTFNLYLVDNQTSHCFSHFVQVVPTERMLQQSPAA